MKKLLTFGVIGLVLAFVLRCSPHFSVLRLQQGIEQGDLNVVMRYADLSRFAELPVDITVAMTAAGMKEATGVLGESLANLLGGALGSTVKQVGGQLAAQELRDRIEKRDVTSLLGGFKPNSGFGWYGGIELLGGDAAILTVVGTCNAREKKSERVETRMGISMVKVPGPYFGLPWDWRASGVEANSMKQLIRECQFSFSY
ncbi:MAG: hypothetical protein GQE15_25780 [Archangiaceae bacterium]|nr:hypothetical protein [Archangiaceae bacterium]